MAGFVSRFHGQAELRAETEMGRGDRPISKLTLFRIVWIVEEGA
jgi:hypothetical protein